VLRVQDLTITLEDQTKIEIYLVGQKDHSVRAMITLPAASAKLFSWHELPRAHSNAKDAFVWALRHAAHFCKRIGSQMSGISNPSEGELISAADQQRIVDVEGITATVRIAGQAAGVSLSPAPPLL
jgi:hypothetical protein